MKICQSNECASRENKNEMSIGAHLSTENEALCVASSSNNNRKLSASDFFPIDGILLGRDSVQVALNKGYKIEKDVNGNSTHTPQDLVFFTSSSSDIFTDVCLGIYLTIPKEWGKHSLSNNMSYASWISFFKSNGFVISNIKHNQEDIGTCIEVHDASFSATSYDGTIRFELDFSSRIISGDNPLFFKKESTLSYLRIHYLL